jgi:site-specific DNA recombinase
MKRAVGFLRVSPRRQAQAKKAFDDQRRQVVRYARERGYDLVDLIEAASTGVAPEGEPTNGQGASLLKLMERAKSGEFEALIVVGEDRLSDDPATVTVLERHFERHGVAVLSTTERRAEPSARAAARAASHLDDPERALRLERFSAGKARKKALGRHVHGRAPYGYRSENGVLEPTEALVPIVRRIFDEAAAGRTPGTIARALNDERVAAPQGGRAWTEQGLRVILGNRAYTGERYGVKGAHAALISEATWTAAQSALRARSRSEARTRPSTSFRDRRAS